MIALERDSGARPAPSRPYRKPLEICAVSLRWEAATASHEAARFVAFRKRQIDHELGRLGLRIRAAVLEDIPALWNLYLERLRPTPARRINGFELYRIIRFGGALVLETRQGGEIVGLELASEYGGGGERTVSSAGVAVHPSLAGHNLGALLLTSSCLCGMQSGATTRRGIVHPRNYASLANAINHMGSLCDGFHREFLDWGEPRFTLCCPLTPGGLANNRIDPRKLAAFLAEGSPGVDYEIVNGDDLDGIDHLYRETPFRVAALLKPERDGASPRLVALPASRLGIPFSGR
jgi:hypothetical protein